MTEPQCNRLVTAAQAMYLPYAMGAFQLLAGGSLVPALTGIAVGHLYYLLDQALPTTNGVRYLDPPAFLYATRRPADLWLPASPA